MSESASWKSLAVRAALRAGLRVYLLALRVARVFTPPQRSPGRPVEVLLTLNYHAAAWPRAVLTPMTLAPACGRLRIVTTNPAPGLQGVEVIHPPRWLQRTVGSTASRLLTFAGLALFTRTEVVGGVHLLFNGLVAAMVARLARAKALYICVGGANEVADGGLHSENRLFSRIGGADPALERSLLAAARAFDTIVTMGPRAADYFRQHGARNCHVIPSGVSATEFFPGGPARDLDVIMVARLVPLKRVDLFVRTISEVARTVPGIRAAIVGRGPMLEPAVALAGQLGMSDRIEFAGHRDDVAVWLRRAKVFVLPSDTESVSTALLEAMLSGAVPVVSDVGDMSDAIDQGENGFLVAERSEIAFAQRVVEILTDDDRRQRLSEAARQTAKRFDPRLLAERWQDALTDRQAREHRTR